MEKGAKAALVVFTIDEVAALLKVHRSKIERLIHSGMLKAFPVGKRMRVRADELERFTKKAG